ncbi:DNA/RNA nuclease SfsA [Candidatus Bathyarchaeota archaeon]|nr:DNA/RNA nuclease SfsA [Candidatus Bathyarchaeota archaeon]
MILLENVFHGRFIERQNRFLVTVDLEGVGRIEAFLPDPGRLEELLVDDAHVLLGAIDPSNMGSRKTAHDLVAVYSGNILVSVDTRVPNRYVGQLLASGFLLEMEIDEIKPEFKYGKSRLDFKITSGNQSHLMEVKSVTLVEQGVAKFPDAPTTRGTRHVRELIEAMKDGFESWIIFAAQRDDFDTFEPHVYRDPDFSSALHEARDVGVNIIVFSSNVFMDGENRLCIEPTRKNIPIRFP